MEHRFAKQIDLLEQYFKPYTDSMDTLKQKFLKLKEVEKKIKKHPAIERRIAELKHQLNFSGYLTISLLDACVIGKNLLSAEYTWERIYQLRSLNLLIFESIKAFDAHNKDLKAL